MGKLWETATPEERKKLAGQAFTAVYVDPDRPGEVLAVLNPALRPLWSALPDCINWVIDGHRFPVRYHRTPRERHGVRVA